MEAAEGESEVPIVAVRRVDCGVIEVQVVRAGSTSRVGRTRPRERVGAGNIQCSASRIVDAITDIPQRRKGIAKILKLTIKPLTKNITCATIEVYGQYRP